MLFDPHQIASLAVQNGAAGIIVSNHGARQLDYVPATITALEEVSLVHRSCSHNNYKLMTNFQYERANLKPKRVIMHEL